MAQAVTVKKRLLVAVSGGLVVAALLIALGVAKFVPLGGWIAIALIYVSWVWLENWKMTGPQTEKHANTEDPGRAIADVLLILASIISLVAVGFMIMQAS